MFKSLSVYTIVLAAFFTFALFVSYTQTSDESSSQGDTTEYLPQVITGIDLHKEYAFAGEAIPKENFDAMERLDRELLVNSYWHSSTVQNIKLANRYFDTISKILAQNGMPDDLKYLAVAESGLRNVTSSAGAKGIWQFMKGTGRDYGLEINDEVDERYHLEKATHAACKYLRKLKERFGTWTLAAAAYNMGANRLSKEMETQRAKTYYDLNLNQETARYVFRILAYKEILNQPKEFGFRINDEHLYAPLDNCIHIKVDDRVTNWGDWAMQNGLSYRMLKVYNPWLVHSSLTNSSKKEYLVKVPKKR